MNNRSTKGALVILAVSIMSVSAAGAFDFSNTNDQPLLIAGNWQTPGEIQQPKGTWQVPGEIQKPSGNWQVPGEIQQPKGTWQVPGEIQQPKGPWQTPGPIQVPKNFKAPIVVKDTGCEHRLAIGADVLFAFNKSELNPNAQNSLAALGTMIQKYGQHPVRVEGHTDGVGSDDYNQGLSDRRAQSVKQWLAFHKYLDETATVEGFGKRKPVAPNTLPDGKDNPKGRQKNRRVEVVVDTCK